MDKTPFGINNYREEEPKESRFLSRAVDICYGIAIGLCAAAIFVPSAAVNGIHEKLFGAAIVLAAVTAIFEINYFE